MLSLICEIATACPRAGTRRRVQSLLRDRNRLTEKASDFPPALEPFVLNPRCCGRTFLSWLFVSSSWGSHSEQPYRKPRPLKPRLSDSEEIRTRRDAAEIDIGSQDRSVVFEFSRGTRAEKFGATWTEQRYIVRPLVASDWQLQVQSLCVTRNL